MQRADKWAWAHNNTLLKKVLTHIPSHATFYSGKPDSDIGQNVERRHDWTFNGHKMTCRRPVLKSKTNNKLLDIWTPQEEPRRDGDRDFCEVASNELELSVDLRNCARRRVVRQSALHVDREHVCNQHSSNAYILTHPRTHTREKHMGEKTCSAPVVTIDLVYLLCQYTSMSAKCLRKSFPRGTSIILVWFKAVSAYFNHKTSIFKADWFSESIK